MVDAINKLFLRLSLKQRRELLLVMEAIRNGELTKLDVKKIVGKTATFRVRKGRFRIFFLKPSVGPIEIIDVVRRNDHTY